jgi:glyoxylase-like metal-dependent hydrolase (beta-lactamase superfamily II)/rhodanese-related sulfurtransferase
LTIEGDDSINNLKIKPEELKKKIDKGDDIFILDVRNHEEHNLWKVSYDRYQDTPVIPVDILSSAQSLKQIPKDKEIVTFCAHGQRSMNAAKRLSELGYNVKTVEGGLGGWSKVFDIASINVGSNKTVKIWQIRRISKGCMSYVITSTLDKKATVIDATCNMDNPINKIMDENGLQITHIIDTHIHADHLSGATKLAKTYESDVYISSLEKYSTENINHDNNQVSFKSIKDGDRVVIGDDIILEAIHTPGHTNGSMTYKLEIDGDSNKTKNENNSIIDKRNNNSVCFLFTGDTLFVDGVGRPDLHNKAEEYAQNLFNSYQRKIFRLSNETIILPSHYGGIFEHERPIYDTVKSVKQNINLLLSSENDFVRFVSENIPPHPVNYDRIISINKQLIACDKIEQNDIEMGPNACGIKT